ncbi:MAG: glycosyltransferase [Lachnospiraceae bacterium]
MRSDLEKYAAMDERILVIAQKYKELSGARNTGMRRAHGEYIMFVDSDDWIEAETCEAAISAALKHGADLVMWSYVKEYGWESKEKYMFWENETIF